ncbi:MAG: hypothetical protein R3190_03725 [Thermoanaerobaculia bacterium]|nr:hypothetical protein [Thermoanaerobaculia bacterium]
MSRTTVVLDDDLHRLLKIRTAAPGAGTFSQELNKLLREALSTQLHEKERIDRALEEGRFLPLEEAVEQMKRAGRL